jgi:hypothetical protein
VSHSDEPDRLTDRQALELLIRSTTALLCECKRILVAQEPLLLAGYVQQADELLERIVGKPAAAGQEQDHGGGGHQEPPH